ncbi:MAG: DUF4838 domain-containing protein, partial [Clostridia bacterium]|nr:DUF4838 domain-containing protein [Clostridia bacterium]
MEFMNRGDLKMRIEIKVNTGMYQSVEEANNHQQEINWWDEKDTRAKYCTESFLAIDLASQLKKVVTDITINNESQSCDVQIIIGKEVTVKSTPDDETGFLKSYMKNGKRIVELYGNRREGTINAVYEFLALLGFRYYNTDSYSEISPNQIVINDFEYQIKPDFVTRGCYNEFTDDCNFSFIEWVTRNRMNMLKVKVYHNPCELKKRGIKLLSGGHEIFYNYLNPNKPFPYKKTGDTYFDVHPEWFAQIEGKRSNRDENKKAKEGYYTGDNICTSNVDGVKELSKNIIASLVDGELKYCDMLNFWAYDNGTWCDCDGCRQSGNYATRMLMTAYTLHKEIKKAYLNKTLGRNVKIIIPIYHETLTPPETDLPDDFDYENVIITFFPIERCYVHYINDPACTESNSHLKRLYDKWAVDSDRKYKGEVFVGEYFNVSSFASLPFVFTDKITHDLKYYYENNTRHFYYMHISTIEWGMLTLNNYLIARLMWDIHCDTDDILTEYYQQIYPDSEEQLKEFHHTLELASENSKFLKHYQFEEKGINKPSLMWGMFEDNLF